MNEYILKICPLFQKKCIGNACMWYIEGITEMHDIPFAGCVITFIGENKL